MKHGSGTSKSSPSLCQLHRHYSFATTLPAINIIHNPLGLDLTLELIFYGTQNVLIPKGSAVAYCREYEDQENLYKKCQNETLALYEEYEGMIEKEFGKPKKRSKKPDGSFPQDWVECAKSFETLNLPLPRLNQILPSGSEHSISIISRFIKV